MTTKGAATALAALIVALVPTVSEAAFTGAVNLSPAGQHADSAQVAVDSQGDALAVWSRLDGTTSSCCFRIQARSRSAAGVLGPAQTLSGGGAFNPQVAVDADGDALVVWEGSGSRIQSRSRSAGGALGPVQALSAAGDSAFEPQVAIDADGDAIAVWRRLGGANDQVQSRARSASGALGPVRTLSTVGQDAYDPQVSITSGGDALAVWWRSDGTNDRIQARIHSAAGSLGPVQNVSAAGLNGQGPELAMSPGGDAVVVWQRFEGTGIRIAARARSAAGTLGPVQTLSAGGQRALDPRVAVDATGDALAVWRPFDGTNELCCYEIEARARSSTGALAPVQTLWPGPDAFEPQVAIDASGNAVAVWRGSVSPYFRIQARTRSAAGTLGPVQNISPDGRDGFTPQVGMGPDGHAFAVWERLDGSGPCSSVGCVRIQGSPGP